MGDRYSLDPKTWSIRDWKNIAWESVHADSLVCPTPAFVFALILSSDGGGEADAIVYDSTSLQATGKHIHLYSADEENWGETFCPPLYFHQGIYVDLGTNAEAVLIQYLPWRD